MSSEVLDISKMIDEEGWIYHDLPRMHKVHYDYVLASMGEEGKDFHMLSKAEYSHPDKPTQFRGQLIISPQGRANIVEYKKTNPVPVVPE